MSWSKVYSFFFKCFAARIFRYCFTFTGYNQQVIAEYAASYEQRKVWKKEAGTLDHGITV